MRPVLDGAEIRRLRQNKRLSRKALTEAMCIRINVHTLKRIENGWTERCWSDIAFALALALGVSSDKLYRLTDEKAA